MEEVLATEGKYRAVLELDEFPTMPENEGAVPSFLIWGGGSSGFVLGGVMNGEHLPATAESLFEKFEVLRWNRPAGMSVEEAFERYLRIFHGAAYAKVRNVHGYSQSDWGYEVEVATPEWLKRMGWEDAAEAIPVFEKESEEPSELLSWALGDCYVIEVQKQTTFVELDDDGNWVEGTESDAWTHVETYGGYYGPSWTVYFRESAIELLGEHTD